MRGDKFIPPFIDLLENQNYFPFHVFYVTGDREKFPIKKRKNVFFSKDFSGKISALVGLLKGLYSADKIIIHRLKGGIIEVLFFQPWLLSKCHWVIWGADLYDYKLAERNWQWKLKEFFRRPVIKRMGHIVTYIEGDVELARKWYGATGRYLECIMYTSNVYNHLEVRVEPHSTINIQIGNSADPTNNHLEILEKLTPFKDQDIAIYAPLSYGSAEYAQKVIAAGMSIFGDKFKPLTDFIPFDQYLEFLGKVDIAIFNHKRQQAMGNTITLLGMGKKVYIRNDVTQWSHFKEQGLTIYSVDQLNLSQPSEVEIDCNSKIIKEKYSIKQLLLQWERIFSEQ